MEPLRWTVWLAAAFNLVLQLMAHAQCISSK